MRETAPGRRNARRNADRAPVETPVISITIPSRGRCHQLARRIGEHLARVHGRESAYHPHLTLQGIYDSAELRPITEAVCRVAEATRPFVVPISGIGILASPATPDLLYLHLSVEKTAALVDLYTRVKRSLAELGLRTYPYSPEEWVPHLTLATGYWSRRELQELLRELEPDVPGCILPVAELDVNHRTATGEWHPVARCPFEGAE